MLSLLFLYTLTISYKGLISNINYIANNIDNKSKTGSITYNPAQTNASNYRIVNNHEYYRYILKNPKRL